MNNQATYRKGNYYWVALPINNTFTAVYESITNLAVLNVGTSFAIQTNIIGSTYLPQTPESFTYDQDGNLTSDGRWAYTWDGENRLIGMVNNNAVGPQLTLAFYYDAKGRRIGKLITAATSTNLISYLYDEWNLVNEISSNAVVRSYVWGSDLSGSLQGAGGVGGLLQATYNSTNCFPSYDGNGNVTALINASDSTVSANYEYGPFGEVIRSTGQLAKLNPFRFSTKYQDDETDLLYYGYRYLNTSSGRWVNRDSIEERGGLNLYASVENNLIKNVDHLGLSITTLTAKGKGPAEVPLEIWIHALAPQYAQLLIGHDDNLGFFGGYGTVVGYLWNTRVPEGMSRWEAKATVCYKSGDVFTHRLKFRDWIYDLSATEIDALGNTKVIRQQTDETRDGPTGDYLRNNSAQQFAFDAPRYFFDEESDSRFEFKASWRIQVSDDENAMETKIRVEFYFPDSNPAAGRSKFSILEAGHEVKQN